MRNDDAMSIAAISVIASSTIALATVASGYFQHRSRLKHERALAFDNRSWDLKSAAHNEIIDVATHVKSAVEHPLMLAHDHDSVAALGTQAPVIFIYGTETCQEDLRELTRLLDECVSQVDIVSAASITPLRRQKEAFVDAGDYQAAVATMRKEKAASDKILASMAAVDLQALEAAADSLMISARASLRAGV